MADEDDDVTHDSEPEPEVADDTEGEGTEGQDAAGRDEESDLSAQHGDAEDDEGQPPSRRAPVDETQQRGGGRYQRLANENRELKERFERAEREREQERQQWNLRTQQQNEQQERERLALMTPEERAEYRITQNEHRTAQSMRQFEMRMAMQADKSAFEAKALTNPVYRRMEKAVEARFQEQLRIGQPTDRETILKFLLGERALTGAANGSKPRRQAARRVENERVAPARPSGDRAQPRRVSTAEERLKDVLI